MTTISRILTVPSAGAYYYEDLAALQSTPLKVEKRYTEPARTPGFQHVREPAEALAVGLVLDEKDVVWGDCVSVAYSGAAGRDPVFRSDAGQQIMQKHINPLLQGKSPASYREIIQEIEAVRITVIEEQVLPDKKPGDNLSRRELLTAPFRHLTSSPQVEKINREQMLPAALRYGLSQVLLKAAAREADLSIPELICRDWDLPLPTRSVPIHAQCGRDRYQGVDRMIARRVSSLPHALVDHIPEQLGDDALPLIKYTRWIRDRIQTLGGKDYHPTIHLDLHGGLGIIYDQDLGKVLGTLDALEKSAAPYPLRIECPVILSTREEQIEALSTLREYLAFRKIKVQIVADEWANTLEDIQAFIASDAADLIQIKMPDLGSVTNTIAAVLTCQENQVGAFMGGSCAETDLTARFSAQLALALQPQLILAKPGMGIDEGITIISNQMARSLSWLLTRQNHP